MSFRGSQPSSHVNQKHEERKNSMWFWKRFPFPVFRCSNKSKSIRNLHRSCNFNFLVQRNTIWQSGQIWANNLRLFLGARHNLLKNSTKQRVPGSHFWESSTLIIRSDYVRLLFWLFPMGLFREKQTDIVVFVSETNLVLLLDSPTFRETLWHHHMTTQRHCIFKLDVNLL